MKLDRISEERLFQTNTREELMHWCPGLNYFHYLRARGGHNCEGDSFYVSFLFDSFDDLTHKLSQIGVTLEKIPEGTLPFDPMARYSLYDLDRIRNVIPGTKAWEQPGFATISGHKVPIWIMNGYFTISVAGSNSDKAYQIDEEDFVVAKEIEATFDKLGWKAFLDRNIINEEHCISRERYPEIFKKPI